MAILTLLSYLRVYLEISLLLGVSFGVFRTLEIVNGKSRPYFSQTWLLKVAYILFFSSILFPIAASHIPSRVLLRPSAQVWSGINRKASDPYALITSVKPEQSSKETSILSGVVLKEKTLIGFLIILITGFLFVGGKFLANLLILRRVLRAQFKIKKIGSVFVLGSEGIAVPFSAWLPGKTVVAIPIELLSDLRNLRIALKHEIQHHRQWDTRLVHALEACKALFFWNPAVYLWTRLFTQLQELACDETLITTHRIAPQMYGRCLVQAAEWAQVPRTKIVGMMCMAAGHSDSELKKRIELIFTYNFHLPRRRLSTVIALGVFILIGSVAFASRSVIQDRKITKSEAQALVDGMSGLKIPITVNDSVLEKLNQFVGTPEGRKYVTEGLSRMPVYQPMIERKIKEYGVPREVLAVGLFESGFDKGAVSPTPYRATGIWQFVKNTARRYDLIVNDHTDERLDPEKETTAAMRYLSDLNGQFHDWRLAIKAYNEGERHVEGLIRKYKTRDPWKLEQADSKEGYLSGALAMMIILKNPKIVD